MADLDVPKAKDATEVKAEVNEAQLRKELELLGTEVRQELEDLKRDMNLEAVEEDSPDHELYRSYQKAFETMATLRKKTGNEKLDKDKFETLLEESGLRDQKDIWFQAFDFESTDKNDQGFERGIEGSDYGEFESAVSAMIESILLRENDNGALHSQIETELDGDFTASLTEKLAKRLAEKRPEILEQIQARDAAEKLRKAENENVNAQEVFAEYAGDPDFPTERAGLQAHFEKIYDQIKNTDLDKEAPSPSKVEQAQVYKRNQVARFMDAFNLTPEQFKTPSYVQKEIATVVEAATKNEAGQFDRYEVYKDEAGKKVELAVADGNPPTIDYKTGNPSLAERKLMARASELLNDDAIPAHYHENLILDVYAQGVANQTIMKPFTEWYREDVVAPGSEKSLNRLQDMIAGFMKMLAPLLKLMGRDVSEDEAVAFLGEQAREGGVTSLEELGDREAFLREAVNGQGIALYENEAGESLETGLKVGEVRELMDFDADSRAIWQDMLAQFSQTPTDRRETVSSLLADQGFLDKGLRPDEILFVYQQFDNGTFTSIEGGFRYEYGEGENTTPIEIKWEHFEPGELRATIDKRQKDVENPVNLPEVPEELASTGESQKAGPQVAATADEAVMGPRENSSSQT